MALCVALLLALGTVHSAGAITLDATDRGQYRPTGVHNPDNLNYLAGDCRFPIQQAGNCFAGSDDFRNFFVFDLSGLTDLITAATLRLNNPAENGFISDAASETYMLYDVTTAIASLIDGTAGVGAWSDLGSGTEFGVHVATAADNEMFVEIDLNPAAVAALNAASGLFAFGGAITTLNGVADEETLFAFTTSFGPLNDTQLELTLVPEPSTLVLLVFALGLLWFERALKRTIKQ